MKCAMLVAMLHVIGSPLAQAEESNPLSKVIQLMDELTAKVTKEGEAPSKNEVHYVSGNAPCHWLAFGAGGRVEPVK